MDYNYIDFNNSNISGIPTNDFYNNNNISYDYIIDNIDNNLNMDVCSEQTDNVSNIIRIKNNIVNILNDNTISKELLNNVESELENIEPETENIESENIEPENLEPENLEPEPESVEIDKELNIDNMCNIYGDFINKYREEQEKYFKCEKDFNNEIEKSKSEIKKLDLIVKFMNEIDQGACNDLLIEDTIDNLKKISIEIDNNSNLEKTRKEYILSRININKYLKMIKKINNMNVSNVCPLCLTNTVSLYLNPCGHTCCDECYERLVSNQDRKCFLCRQHIMNKNPLYFS